ALGDRLGPRIPMTVGPLLAAVGVGLLARLGPDASFLVDVLGPVTLLAAGLTVTVTPLTATVLGAVEEERAGLASGVNNAVARTGGLLLVAVLPALTSLGADGFADPAALAPAFTSAMLICAGLLALGGVVAALTLRPTATPAGVGEEATCPPRHCAVDTSPVGVTHRPPP
ncbi:MAG: MFS transporter, partial [Actinomycetes bacterium]|nr:MFS transporter [Actinomycetes bacterium]MDX5381000.1 MFS transporter [Actinomycetes bacterium]MDX5400142.1 MFS transporter [Actinomycetes bacterium]MDX5450761.1 MFS transporter [Actinomycetes bacterium]